VRDPRAAEFHPGDWIFLDLETTGLGPSTGVLPFLIGIAWIEGETLRAEQFLLHDLGAEPDVLRAVAARVGGFAGIATFNGKSFDLPLLRVRHALARQDAVHFDRPHCDILHVARRIWSHRVPDRRLRTLERCIAGRERRGDIAGALVPQLFQEALRSGDATRLDCVLIHNRQDLFGLCDLVAAAAGFLSQARAGAARWPPDRAGDLLHAARIMAEARDWETAARLFEQCLALLPPAAMRLEALVRLAGIEARHGSKARARECTRAALELDPDTVELYEDMARWCEGLGDATDALAWVDRGLARPLDGGGRIRLERRRRRLARRVRMQPGNADFFLAGRPVNC
jgi:hypothetical protein